jgi:transposase InsO family protein
MHRNAPLTPEGRLRLCRLIEDGWTIASSAESMRISRQTAHKWWRRFQEAGEAGLVDRSSRPRRCPTKTSSKVERKVIELRRRHQLGPARLAPRAGIPASTLHRILARHGVSRLSDLDRASGRVIRRIETSHPGELVHMDIKKQARIPKGGGWRVNGVAKRPKGGRGGRPKMGYAFIHSTIDAHSRLAYSEVHANEQAMTMMSFWRRALKFFASYGITVERVMTDNGSCYRWKDFNRLLVEQAIEHTYTRPFRPQSNGKAERYNRTLLNEWAYARPYRSEAARTRALDTWLHMYNHHRHHTALGGPTSQSNQQPGGAEQLGRQGGRILIPERCLFFICLAEGGATGCQDLWAIPNYLGQRTFAQLAIIAARMLAAGHTNRLV